MNAKEKAAVERHETKRRAKDISMIGRPNDWPRWPRLPLKRGPQNNELAVCIESGKRFDVYHCDLFTKISGATPFTHYESAEAIVADGWRVD